MNFKIKWVMPKDKSKLFWKITCPDDDRFEAYASKLNIEVPSTADHNRIYCKGNLTVDEDKTAHFFCYNEES